MQPPGRESRFSESPYVDVIELAEACAEVIASTVNGPYALFGHSAGALSAWATAHRLQAMGAPALMHLFVCGRAAPDVPLAWPNLFDIPLPEVAMKLRDLGGTPAAVLERPEALQTFRGVIAADIMLNGRFDFVDRGPLDIAVTGFAGFDDPHGNPETVATWSKHTSRTFNQHDLPGGHFARFDHAPVVHRLVTDTLGAS